MGERRPGGRRKGERGPGSVERQTTCAYDVCILWPLSMFWDRSARQRKAGKECSAGRAVHGTGQETKARDRKGRQARCKTKMEPEPSAKSAADEKGKAGVVVVGGQRQGDQSGKEPRASQQQDTGSAGRQATAAASARSRQEAREGAPKRGRFNETHPAPSQPRLANRRREGATDKEPLQRRPDGGSRASMLAAALRGTVGRRRRWGPGSYALCGGLGGFAGEKRRLRRARGIRASLENAHTAASCWRNENNAGITCLHSIPLAGPRAVPRILEWPPDGPTQR